MTLRPSGFWRSERALLGLLLALHGAVTLWLILDRRLPRGHDTLGNYFLQYLFAAHAAQGDGVALWLPYVAHGLVSNWAFTLQGGLFQSALLAVGGPPPGTNFLVLFHLGMFFDELVLILGLWSLGRRFGLSPLARFVTAAAAAGSLLWVDQIYWNHRVLFALPLVLSLLQGFLEEGSGWKLHLGLNLLVLQILGNVPYIAFLTGLVAATYLLVYILVWRRRILRSWSGQVRRRLWALLGLPLALAALAAVAVTFAEGTGEILQYRHGREEDGSVPFESFLTYGGGTTPLRYLDLLMGASPAMEYSLYAGAPVVALAFLAFALRPGRRVVHLGVTLFLVFSFSLGVSSVIPAVAYETIPLLQYFRYIALAAPIAKLLLILLAGIGFDALLRRPVVPSGPRRAAGAILLGSALAVGGLSLLVLGGALHPDEILQLLKSTRFGTSSALEMRDRSVLGPVLGGAALAAAAAAALLFRGEAARRRGSTLVLLALLGAVDAYRWKVQMLAVKTVPLDDAAYATHRVTPIPYEARRHADYARSERHQALAPFLFDYGVTYDFTDGFLHLDPPSSRFWTHHWLRPVDALARAYGTKLHRGDRAAALAALRQEHRRLFPRSLPPYDALLGISEDKLRLFSRAHSVPSDTDLAGRLNDPAFQGHLLLLSAHRKGPLHAVPVPDRKRLEEDDRAPGGVRVVSFGAHRIVVEVTPEAGRSPAWLSYADAWHPGWTATVNGQPAPVERAWLGYKAVCLRPFPGPHTVEFRFEAPLRTACARALGLNALAWVLGAVAFALRLLGARLSRRALSGG